MNVKNSDTNEEENFVKCQIDKFNGKNDGVGLDG